MAETFIREIAPSDRGGWESLWQAYLSFYEQDLAPEVTNALFERLLGKGGHFGLVAEQDDKLVGFVHSLPHASTWSIAPTCYLEDLYVDASARGGGVGRQLIEAVYAKADALGCSNVYWHTDDDNSRARQLYDRIGVLSSYVRYTRPPEGIPSGKT